MASLFGPVEPVPAERLRVLDDGTRLDIGGRTLARARHAGPRLAPPGAAWTPRPAWCSPATRSGSTSRTSRSCGRRTPPPEFDLELAVASIERIRARGRAPPCCSRTSGRSPTSIARATSRSRRLNEWTDAVRGADAIDDRPRRDRRGRSLERRPRETVDRGRGATRPGSVRDARRHPDERHGHRALLAKRPSRSGSASGASPQAELSQALRGVERARRRAASPCGTARPPPRLRPARARMSPFTYHRRSVYVLRDVVARARPAEERQRLRRTAADRPAPTPPR